MVKEFVDAWNSKRSAAEAALRRNLPTSYEELVRFVVGYLGDEMNGPDPERVTEIRGEEYSGKAVYVVADRGYAPTEFWAVGVWYGSCSGCDTLERILDEGSTSTEPTESQVSQVMTMALHVVQQLKPIAEDSV